MKTILLRMTGVAALAAAVLGVAIVIDAGDRPLLACPHETCAPALPADVAPSTSQHRALRQEACTAPGGNGFAWRSILGALRASPHSNNDIVSHTKTIGASCSIES